MDSAGATADVLVQAALAMACAAARPAGTGFMLLYERLGAETLPARCAPALLRLQLLPPPLLLLGTRPAMLVSNCAIMLRSWVVSAAQPQ